jgi:G patch domain-containing protein 1
MSAKSKERLAQATGVHQSTGVALTLEESVESQEGVLVPPLSPRTASAALKGFIPFGDDLAKQDRYKSYLVSQTYNTTEPNPKLLPGRPVNEVNKELSDFSKSAAMFKPMSFAMANRFTTSTASAQDVLQPKPGLHIPDPDKLDEWLDKSKTQEEVKEVLTPRQAAAKAGMYGKMTRTEENWVPNKLLCKRFGVADPYPDGLPGTSNQEPTGPAGGTLGTRPLLTAPGQDIAWQNKFINVPPPDSGAGSPEAGAGGSVPRQPKSLAEVGLADDENQGRDTLTYKKPEIDIFKAIFADDEDDEDEDDQEQEQPTSNAASQLPAVPPSKLQQSASTALVGGPSQFQSQIPLDAGTDPLSYRPVFARPSTKRDIDEVQSDVISNGNSATADAGKSKKSKKEKKDKKANKILMSFDVGEDEEDTPADRKSKKKRDKGKRASPDEEEMWVEKEVVVESLPSSKRKRAEDFL